MIRSIVSMGMSVVHMMVVLVVIVIAWLVRRGGDEMCEMEGVSFEGKVVIVTGANTGIGYQIALEVARR